MTRAKRLWVQSMVQKEINCILSLVPLGVFEPAYFVYTGPQTVNILGITDHMVSVYMVSITTQALLCNAKAATDNI